MLKVKQVIKHLINKIMTISFFYRSVLIIFLGATMQNGANAQVEQFKKVSDIEHVIVRYSPEEFSAWPANNGIWHWEEGNDILVGFTSGRFVDQDKGHKVENPKNALARSLDGGMSWETYVPDNIAEENIFSENLLAKINFRKKGFALRIRGQGYHGNNINEPVLYYSYNKGQTWNGPYGISGLSDMEQLKEMAFITPRTDYIVEGKHKCIMLFSATSGPWKDKSFAIRTNDGGKSFSFVSWIVPSEDPYRAVMPQTISTGRNKMISVLRRRDMPPSSTQCWIDAYKSSDGGKNWSVLSKVAYTGEGNSNGNPPALTKLMDNRLIVVYGNRSLRMLLCRVSEDNGKTWGDEIILRDDFIINDHGFADFGYPRVLQRNDGKIVVIYYFATKDRPHQHIVCSIFTLDNLSDVEVKREIN
jgi:hypothetical protein